MSARLADVAIPVLASLNFDQTVDFYEALGFTTLAQFPDYAIVRRDGLELHFWQCEDRAICEATSCYLRVADAAAYHEEWQAVVEGAGGRINEIEDKPWGMREFAVWDLHGNLIKVGQEI
ncbi:MAG: VOC family protein [Pseudomonadota bacterium]